MFHPRRPVPFPNGWNLEINMLYADNQFKWVVVCNRKVPLPRLFNAIGHLALGMKSRCNDDAARQFHNYDGADGELYSTISNWPFIVLQANNGNQLRTLRAAANAARVECQAFVDSMIGQSAEDQLQKTKQTNDEDVEYFAVLVFGKSDVVHAMTKKFSLFSPPTADANQPAAATV